MLAGTYMSPAATGNFPADDRGGAVLPRESGENAEIERLWPFGLPWPLAVGSGLAPARGSRCRVRPPAGLGRTAAHPLTIDEEPRMRTTEQRRSKPQGTRTVGRALLGALAVAGGLAVAGCRVSNDDLKRWESTEHGPDKLAAVLTHDKYDKTMRVEAAWSLVEMKKRGGQPVGIVRLIDELATLSPKERNEIVDGLWKKLEPQVRAPIEGSAAAGYKDTSAVFKDATASLLIAASDAVSGGPPKLELEPAVTDGMRASLADWAVGKIEDGPEKRLSAFEIRMDNSGQQYGVEQIVRRVGQVAVKRLPSLLTSKDALRSARVEAIARLVMDLKPTDAAQKGDWQKAADELSTNVAALFDKTAGNDYIVAMTPEVTTELKKVPSGEEVLKTPAKMQAYMDELRKSRLEYLFSVMKAVGGRPIAQRLIAFAGDDNQKAELRSYALIALQKAIDTSNDSDLKALLAIAKGKAPNDVKSNALVCIKQYPTAQVVKAFYDLFGEANWKVRYTAAMSVIDLMKNEKEKSGTSVKEFLDKLPAKAEGSKMGLAEFHTYAKALAALPDTFKAKDALGEALTSPKFGAKMVALGYYVEAGQPSDAAALSKFGTDKEAVPKCDADDDCGWDRGCEVPKAGGKPDETETKPVATIGEYVNYCVLAQIDRRAKSPEKK
jgi:hypothetical protein